MQTNDLEICRPIPTCNIAKLHTASMNQQYSTISKDFFYAKTYLVHQYGREICVSLIFHNFIQKCKWKP